MGQDGEIRQGPHTELKEIAQREFEFMLAQDRRVERRLVWKEWMALAAAAAVVLVGTLVGRWL